MSTDASIATQVAIKEAANLVVAGKAEFGQLEDTVALLVQAYIDGTTAIAGNTSVAAPPAAAAVAAPVAAAPAPAPAAAPAASGQPAKIRKLNESLGVPDWFASVVPAGIEVWDNRADLPKFGGSRNPKSPWFKAVDGGDGYWPPKGHADAS